jgi:acetyl esterase/lipase
MTALHTMVALQTALALLAIPAPARASEAPPALEAQASGAQRFEFQVRDVVYQRNGDKVRVARLYQPAGTGPFPAVVQVHGGAWNNKDRTDGQQTAMDFVSSGIVVLSLEFRNAPEAPYPASLQDINYGIRWLKAHAREFGSSADRVGLYGTSSGGHQALLAAIRPADPRYTALPLAEAPQMDARVAFVVSGWPVLYPLERYKLARAQGKMDTVKSHDTFFRDEQTQIEATPTLAIERGEKLHFPPAMVYQGTADEWTSVEQAERLAAAYRGAGGSMDLLLLPGEHHTFVNEHPFSPNAVKAVAAATAFIKKHGSAKASTD